MKERPRPDFIRHWSEIEPGEPFRLTGYDEAFGFDANFSHHTGMTRLGLHHVRIPPGRRSGLPHAERDEEEFVFVLEGEPDLWADGELYRLRDGDGVAFPDRTGIGHCFLNNTDKDVCLFVMGEGSRYASRLFHPLDAKANAAMRELGKLWEDAPKRKLGPHDGLPHAAGKGHPRRRKPPSFVVNWRDILGGDTNTYPNSPELHGIDSLFGRHFCFSRIGVHLEILKPGRRTSWPHAERDEEEFVYVVSGNVDAWIDGALHAMHTGDFIGFPSRTGITHVIINNGEADAVLIVGGEASRARNRFFYPLHPKRNQEIGDLLWTDPPKRRLGPHDGLPDALRTAQAQKPKPKRKPAGCR